MDKQSILGNKTAETFLIMLVLMMFPTMLTSLGFSINLTFAMGGAYMLAFILAVLRLPIAFLRIKIDSSIIILLLGLNFILTILFNEANLFETNLFDFVNFIAKINGVYLFYILIGNVEFSELALKRYAKLMMILAIVACIYNIVFNFSTIVSGVAGISSYAIQFRSFFFNRNQFGMFLVVCIFLLEFVFSSNEKWMKYIVLLVLLINLILSMSRGSIVSVMFFYFMQYALKHDFKQCVFKSVKVLAVVSIIFVIVVCYLPGLKNFFQNMVIRSDTGLSGRDSVWQMGLDVASLNIINGVGTFTGIDIAKNLGFKLGQFHSLYIDTLVSGGIVELIIIIFVYFKAYQVCSRCPNRDIGRTFRAFLLAVLLMGINESVSFFSIGYVDMFFTINCIALPFLISNIENRKYSID